MVAALLLCQSVFQSWATAVVTVGTTYLLLAVVLPRRSQWALAAAAAALVVVLTPPSGPLWFMERGWALLVAGWFAALTLRWPNAPFAHRGMGAVTGATSIAALIFMQRPADWRVVEGFVARRLEMLRQAVESVVAQQSADPSTTAFMNTVIERTLEIEKAVFPGLLVVGSLAALAVGWWLYVKIALRRSDGLGTLAQFRFHDGLVWMVVGAMAILLAWPGGVAARMGWNALVVVGSLYALRGAAVVAFVLGGMSVLNVLLVALAMLVLPAFILSFALVIGLSDTWLDLRGKAAAIQKSGD